MKKFYAIIALVLIETVSVYGQSATTSFSGNVTVNAGVPLPNTNTPTCWAEPSIIGGNDSNIGIIEAFPKLDIMSCVDMFNSGTSNGNGTIYVKSVTTTRVNICPAGSPTGCGFWAAGNGDSQYASLPTGWRQLKGKIDIIGVAGAGCYFGGYQCVFLSGGSLTDATKPSLWLSGTTLAPSFTNVEFEGCQPAALGVDSTGVATLTSWIWNMHLDNVDFQMFGASPSCGPDWIVEGQSSHNVVNNVVLVNGAGGFVSITSSARSGTTVTATTTAPIPSTWTGTVNHIGIFGQSDSSFNQDDTSIAVVDSTHFTYTSAGIGASATGGEASDDLAQNAVFEKGSGAIANSGAGFTFVNLTTNGGSMRFYKPGEFNNIQFMSEMLQEAGVSPAIEVAGQGGTQVDVDYLQAADQIGGGFPNVNVNPAGNNTLCCRLRNVVTSNGPSTVLGGGTPQTPAEYPAIENQVGFFGGEVIGKIDSARALGVPISAKYTNLVGPSSGWAHTNVTLATGEPDPLKGTNAIFATTAQGTTQALGLYTHSVTVGAGDIFGCVSYTKSLNPPTYLGAANGPVDCGLTAVTEVDAWNVVLRPNNSANGEWDYSGHLHKIGYVSGSSAQMNFNLNLNSSFGIGVYRPMLFYVPAAAGLTDNEVAYDFQHSDSWDINCVVGQTCSPKGQQFRADSMMVGSAASQPTITGGSGAPAGACQSGSIYLRSDGGSGTGFYSCESSAWVAK